MMMQRIFFFSFGTDSCFLLANLTDSEDLESALSLSTLRALVPSFLSLDNADDITGAAAGAPRPLPLSERGEAELVLVLVLVGGIVLIDGPAL